KTDAVSGWNTGRFIDKNRGARLRKELALAAGVLSEALPESGELDLDGVRLRVRHKKENLNVGPAHLSVSRGEKAVAIQLTTAPSAEHSLKLGLDLPFGSGDVTARIEGGPVSLAALGVQDGNLGLQKVDKATLEARATTTLSGDGSRLAWSGLLKLAHGSITKAWLAHDPVEGIDVSLRGRGSLGLDGTWLRVDQADLDIGKIRVELKGSLEQSADSKKTGKHLVIEGGVPLASCQSVIDSLPKGLAPLLDGMQMTGTFALAGKLEVDTLKLDKMVARYTATNECRISSVPADVSPRKFQQSWSRTVLSAEGKPALIQSGPGTASWVPRDAISRHMETAVLICEDGAFFRHKGFDDEAIQNSLRENIKQGHFVRGASTISMQLSKNLYLPREKTVSRKLQEAVLTMLLEQELTKDQIMELYLNVIEFGPGIYGIGPAANYYFNTSAGRLSLGQSLYLGSILPNPKRQYFGADGAVTPGWTSYLRKLMRIAVKIRRVSEPELEEALVEQVKFKVPYAREVEDDTTEAEDTAAVPGAPPPPPM
ncbi:MAG: biosynthetic peptidoglycan transglycosylase, partial [Acidobacteriota bacterium]